MVSLVVKTEPQWWLNNFRFDVNRSWFRFTCLSSYRFCVALLSFYSPLKLQLKQSQNVHKRSRSDGEYSDGEIVLNPLAEVDLPPVSAKILKEGHANHSKKQRSPMMGGLFFLPVGIFVANFVTGFSSVEVAANFTMIGPIDDVLCVIKQHNSGLSPRLRLLLEVATFLLASFFDHLWSIRVAI
ncbi:hypothetical protein V6N13_075965 [Hibiscus sabdariffa]|uniref:Uncharacterized protein n=1 Tax=Hibiscus sabdariffa TaxID=183260 RepID=A0ABR2UD23_9ROSI